MMPSVAAFELLDGIVSMGAINASSAVQGGDLRRSLDISDLALFSECLRQLQNEGFVVKVNPESVRETVRYYADSDRLLRFVASHEEIARADDALAQGEGGSEVSATISKPLNRDELYLLGLLLAKCDDHIGTVFDLKELQTESFSKAQARTAASALNSIGFVSLSAVKVPGQRRADDLLMLTPLGLAFCLRSESLILNAMLDGGSIQHVQHVREAYDRFRIDSSDSNGLPGSHDVLPASDRVVRLDHNSREVLDIKHQLSELREKLRTGNDLGSFREEEAEAAAVEVEQLELAFSRPTVRARWLMLSSNETLQWIGKEAAGAVVGTIALAVLALIGSFLGLV
jgi:hypothetical protein